MAECDVDPTPSDVDHVARAAAPWVACLLSRWRRIGTHFNPAFTLAFAVRRDFRWSRVPLYWLAQLARAVSVRQLAATNDPKCPENRNTKENSKDQQDDSHGNHRKAMSQTGKWKRAALHRRRGPR
jgi:hypothetical protein